MDKGATGDVGDPIREEREVDAVFSVRLTAPAEK
jgi:hypothetical protein